MEKMAVSPQSSWSTSSLPTSWSESLSSSKQSSEVSSPPSTPSASESDAWDLLNAAAGEVARLKLHEERGPPLYNAKHSSKYVEGTSPETVKQCGLLPQQPSPWRTQPHPVPLLSSPGYNAGTRSSATIPSSKDRIVGGGGSSQTPRTWNRSRDEDRKASSNAQAQHRPYRNDGGGWNQRQNRPANTHKGGVNQKIGRQNYSYGSNPRMSGKNMDWNGGSQRPGLQGVNVGSGMRAVFLGSAGSGRESGGTGVFFPRCIGGGSEHRRKPACSTVLLPSRIVQVLNLNVEDMRSHPATLPSVASHSRADFVGALRTPSPHMYLMELTGGNVKYEGSNVSIPRKFQGSHHRQSEPVEISLPSEWTY